jgi:hypothetical protein
MKKERCMRARLYLLIVAMAASVCGAAAHAGEAAAEGPMPEAACELPRFTDGLLAHREEGVSRFEAMSSSCRKALVVRCNQSARTQLLDLGTAAVCSVGYEALLRRDFAGDFHKLMAWWQAQPQASSTE